MVICCACEKEIHSRRIEEPTVHYWQTSVFVNGREYRYHWDCYVTEWDGKQRRLA
jgi:hypothetical protein